MVKTEEAEVKILISPLIENDYSAVTLVIKILGK